MFCCFGRSQSDRDAALNVQLNVFDEENARDAEQLPGPAGVDLNSHVDVFHAVLKQVRPTDKFEKALNFSFNLKVF